MTCKSCNTPFKKDDLAITLRGLAFHRNCAYDFAQCLLRTYAVTKPQPDFAAKQEVSNQIQRQWPTFDEVCNDPKVRQIVEKARLEYANALAEYETTILKGTSFQLSRLYDGEMWDKGDGKTGCLKCCKSWDDEKDRCNCDDEPPKKKRGYEWL